MKPPPTRGVFSSSDAWCHLTLETAKTLCIWVTWVCIFISVDKTFSLGIDAQSGALSVPYALSVFLLVTISALLRVSMISHKWSVLHEHRGGHSLLHRARLWEMEAVANTGKEVNKGDVFPPGQPKCTRMLLATPRPHQAPLNVCVKSSQGGAAA